MKTEYLLIDKNHPDPETIKKAAYLLRKGELVAFPTETVYGLGADALNKSAVEKIFFAKGRPNDNPLIVHVASWDQLHLLVREIPPSANLLMDTFWPGPLTIIFPKSDAVPREVTAGLDTVAVRMPEHPVALALIRQADLPIAAPSANLSSKPSPTLGQHVWEDLKGKIPLILDAGETRVGLESTVLDISGERPVILRPGGITREMLETFFVSVEEAGGGKETVPRAPGMKYTHYCPEAEVLIVAESTNPEHFIKAFSRLHRKGKKVALLVSQETAREIKGRIVPVYMEILGSRANLVQAAHQLFSAFRNCDEAGADIVLIEEFPESEIGSALMNRIRKAAGNKIIKGDKTE